MEKEITADDGAEVDDRLRTLSASVAKLFAGTPVLLAFFHLFGWLASGDVDIVLALTPDARFALLAVLVTAAAEFVALASTIGGVHTETGDLDESRAALATFLDGVSWTSATAAALVGWMVLLESAPHRIEVASLLWFGVTVGIAAMAVSVDMLVPDEIARALRICRARRRLTWINRIAPQWSVRRRAHRILAELVTTGLVPLVALVVVYAFDDGLTVADAAGAWFMLVVPTGLLAAALGCYVLRNWLGALFASAGAFLLFVLVAIVALLHSWSASPWVAVTWCAALAFLAAVFAMNVIGEVDDSHRPRALRWAIGKAISRDRTRLNRVLNPACTCQRKALRFPRASTWHARMTGRDLLSVAECRVHRSQDRSARSGALMTAG